MHVMIRRFADLSAAIRDLIPAQSMLQMFRKLFSTAKTASCPSLHSGERVYAIGDIHGRLDLFEELLRRIEIDEQQRSPARTTIVLLGDLIDRGPHSAGVVSRARTLAAQRPVEILSGNHEEMMLSSLEDPSAMRGFLRFGGVETLLSYGIERDVLLDATIEDLQALAASHIPAEDLDFLRSFKKFVRIDDYIFVHAGLRPGIPLEMQLLNDCRWIREPFLSHDGDFGGFVVHGHTIVSEPDERHNRVGIDTGAYLNGTLTAIGIEGTQRWFLSTQDNDAEAAPMEPAAA